MKCKKCGKEMVLMTVYIAEVAEVQLLGCSHQAIQTLVDLVVWTLGVEREHPCSS